MAQTQLMPVQDTPVTLAKPSTLGNRRRRLPNSSPLAAIGAMLVASDALQGAETALPYLSASRRDRETEGDGKASPGTLVFQRDKKHQLDKLGRLSKEEEVEQKWVGGWGGPSPLPSDSRALVLWFRSSD